MVPQLDTSFYISQIFWLVVCLIILVLAFKKIFIPRISALVSKREEHINSLRTEVKKLEKQIVVLSSELNSIKQNKILESNKIIEDAKYKCEILLRERNNKIQTEHDASIKRLRKEANVVLKNLKQSLNTQIESVSQQIFDKLFQDKRN